MSPAPRLISWTLWVLAGLFLLRVVGQAMQKWMPQPFLPPFDSFQGSSLPYALLLTVQLVIVTLLFRTARRVAARTLAPNARAGRVLGIVGGLYLVLAVARIAIGLVVPDAAPWFHAWIPAAFHVVLAAFVVTLGAYHRLPVQAS